MISIQVDEHTAEMIEQQARAKGLSVADFLRSLVPLPSSTVRPNWDDIEGQIMALSTAGPVLPADFSRADIYRDHA
jgi:hypothetical protein